MPHFPKHFPVSLIRYFIMRLYTEVSCCCVPTSGNKIPDNLSGTGLQYSKLGLRSRAGTKVINLNIPNCLTPMCVILKRSKIVNDKACQFLD